MRPRTPTEPAPGRPAVRPGPSASEVQAIDDVVRRLRHAQGQVNAMLAQLDQIASLLRDVQRSRPGGGPARAPLDLRAVAYRRAPVPARRDRRI